GTVHGQRGDDRRRGGASVRGWRTSRPRPRGHAIAAAGAMTASTPRLDPLEVRRTLRREGLRASHARSQNFLADPDVLQAILDLAEAGPGTRVLEIGPGLGILTGGLLQAGASVTAVELDAGLAAYLRAHFAASIDAAQLTLLEGNALDRELPTLVPNPYRVVANVPYHITSPILHRLLGGAPPPQRLVLMLQAEVAERIAAPPGRMSYLSVFVQFHATVRVAPVVRLAPAKLNLTLAVLGVRTDGYHDLHSVMVPLGLADRLSLARAAGPADSLHVVGGVDGRTTLDPAAFDSVLTGIGEARRAVGRGADAFPIAARLEKRIPIAAGLAGGSSDAAAAIDGALEAWAADLAYDDRRRAAAATG